MSERVLVTGATGCLGSNLVHQLVRDRHEVVVLVPFGEQLGRLSDLREELDVCHGDVRNQADVEAAMRGVTQLYHVAGIAIPSNRVERAMWEVNVVGVHNVMTAARRAGVRRAVHVSSTAAIGYPPDGTVANESFPFDDSVCENAYSRTKRRGEEIALSFNDAGLEVVVVNPSAVIAPGGDRRFGWGGVVEVALRGLLRVLPSGASSFCSAADLVHGVVRAMERGRAGERYILSSENLSYRELGLLIARALGAPPPIATAPAWILRLLAAANDALLPQGRISVLVPENVDLMTRSLFYDQSKAVRELGMSQTPVSAALAHVNEWIQSAVRAHVSA